MKKLLLFLMLASIYIAAYSQRWELFKNDFSHYTTSTPNTNFGRSISTDLSAYTLKVDTTMNYSNRKVTVFDGDFSENDTSAIWKCFSYSPSLLGDSIAEYTDSSIYYINNEKLVWKNDSQWTFYANSNGGKLIISLDSTYLLRGDSIKKYSFYSLNSAQFDTLLFSTPIIVSKSNGMIDGFDFSYFPNQVKPIAYFYNGSITTSAIYDLEIGNEYHYQNRLSLNRSFSTTDLFIKKVIGKITHGQDSVTYTFERQVRDDSLVVVNNNPFPTHHYVNYQDTVIETFNLKDTLLSGAYLDGQSLNNSQGMLSSLGIYDGDFNTPTFVKFDEFGIQGDTLCDYTFERESYSTYVFGIGMFYHFENGDISSYYLTSEELLYYQKGTKTWGNPISIPVGLNESILSEISFYPNPIKDRLYIENLKEDVNYELISVNGALIQRGVLIAGTNSLSLNNINKGIYFLQLRTSEEVKTIKVVKG